MGNKQKKGKNQKKSLPRKIVALIIVLSAVLFWTLFCAIGALQNFDYRVYDLMLGFVKNPDTRKEILLVEADNISTSNDSFQEMKTWPWPRNIFANALLRMKEFGAGSAVFDIEYLSPSNLAVNEDAIIDAAANFDGSRPNFESFIKDNDDYFSRAIQFFGNTWLTINTLDIDMKYSDEEIEYVKKRFLYNAEDKNDLILKDFRQSRLDSIKTSFIDNFTEDKPDWDNPDFLKKYIIGFSPAMHQFISHANGAGFTNVIIDMDGTRRRIELLNKKDDVYSGQLSFAPIVRTLNPEKIIREKSSLRLEKCSGLNGKTIKIPLDSKGKMLINWLHSLFVDSFRHESMFFLAQLDELEKNILAELKSLSGFLTSLDSAQIPGLKLDPLQSAAAVKQLVADYKDITDFKEYLLSKCEGYDIEGNAIGGGIDDSEYEQYFQARKDFFDSVTAFCKGNSMDEIADRLLALSEYIPADEYQVIQTELAELFDTLESENSLYNSIFADKKAVYENSFCILGHTASSTTDLGTTPFERAYMNVGTHANVYNTIMNQDFIYPVDWGWGVVIAAIFAIVLIVLPAEKRDLIQNTTGVLLVLLSVFVPFLLIRLFNVYIPAFTPFLIAFTSYLAMTIYRFATSESDKKFIKSAFSQCLAPAVVDEIIKNPSSFKLGGQTIEMTAIFTDIQKFSGFSELLSAAQLVALLNFYLSQMSDIIMDNRGTVDKYEGDAIVAFVGAPLKTTEHAALACRSAIKMKKTEREMNTYIEDVVTKPKPEDMEQDLYDAFCIMVKNKKTIFTRIGLNSGEIVAGYMGSTNKKNYTIMGNNVNLASRLEGVNKQYRTGGILMSEATRKGLDESFIVRSLDRVQVVNVVTPIRLYELLDLRETADENLLDYVASWEDAMKVFESGDYAKALEMLKKLSELRPEDNTAKYYIELIEKFFIKGSYPTENDDFGVAYNAENPENMKAEWIGTAYEIKGTFKLLQK